MLYTVRKYGNVYNITKFDKYYNVEKTYKIIQKPRSVQCNCPGYHYYRHCKHQSIFRQFASKSRIDTGWFWNSTTNQWEEPLEVL